MPEHNHPAASKGSTFVRKYLTGIFLMIGLVVLSVFLGFSYRSNSLIKAQLLAALRDYDIACRYGGEEFLVVAPETDAAQALKLAERLRATIATSCFSTDQHELSVTASIGVTLFTVDDTIEKVFNRADAALYQAKEAGRNQVAALIASKE